MANLLDGGFPGPVVPVNPRRRSVFGQATVPSLEALDHAVDAVVVATPADTVPEVVEAAGRIGCGGAVVYAAQFAETGRVDRQRALAAAAARHTLPVVGPNANGIVSLPRRAALWGDSVRLTEPGPVAFISQSGNLGVGALAARRGLRLHTVVSVGNQAVVTAADVLGALPRLGGVRSVALYLEDDGRGQDLAEALARCCDDGIRVVVLKAGRSQAGAAAGGAHTAALAGDHRVFAALVAEAGGAVVDDLHQLFETAKALAAPPPGRRGGLAVLTCSGGDSVIVADEAESLGVPLAPFTAETEAAVSALLPAGTSVTNPLDHTNELWDDDERLRALAAVVTADPGVAQLLYVQDTPAHLPELPDAEWRTTREAVTLGGAADVPAAVAAGLPELMPEHVADELLARGVLPFLGLPTALAALRAAATPVGEGTRMRAIAAAAAAGPRDQTTPGAWLAEHEAKQLVASHGVPVPRGRAVTTADAAVDAAGALRQPVAVKLSHPAVQHKSDIGGVVLGLSDPAPVRAAAESVLALLEGGVALVEEMAEPGVELMVSVSRDGVVPHLVLALGGVWTELLDDAVVVPLPVTADQVLEALDRLAGASLLHGGRGRSGVDRTSLARLAVGAAEAFSSAGLSLLELNPVLATPTAAVAVDAIARH
jgi:acetyl-CoA synthetase